jgi:hypothetical protein
MCKGFCDWIVVMYLRFTRRKNSDGSVVRYVALAHNYRIDGQTKPQVLLNLGRVNQLDLDGCVGWPPRSTSVSRH